MRALLCIIAAVVAPLVAEAAVHSSPPLHAALRPTHEGSRGRVVGVTQGDPLLVMIMTCCSGIPGRGRAMRLRGGAIDPLESFSMNNLDQMPTEDDLLAGNIQGGGEDFGGEDMNLERMMGARDGQKQPQMTQEQQQLLQEEEQQEQQQRTRILQTILAPEARQRREPRPLPPRIPCSPSPPPVSRSHPSCDAAPS